MVSWDLLNEAYWYAFYVKPRHEKKVRDRLIRQGITVYLPLWKHLKQWKDRKKMVDEPLIRGYVFCRIKLHDRMPVLETPGVLNILKFAGKWSPIPDRQIENLKIMLESPETLQPEAYIKVGQRVRVVRGPFRMVEGIVTRQDRKSRLTLSLDNLQVAFSVEVNAGDLEVI